MHGFGLVVVGAVPYDFLTCLLILYAIGNVCHIDNYRLIRCYRYLILYKQIKCI